MKVDRKLMERARYDPEGVREILEITGDSYMKRSDVRRIILEQIRTPKEDIAWAAMGGGIAGGLLTGLLTGECFMAPFGLIGGSLLAAGIDYQIRDTNKRKATNRYCDAIIDFRKNRQDI